MEPARGRRADQLVYGLVLAEEADDSVAVLGVGQQADVCKGGVGGGFHAGDGRELVPCAALDFAVEKAR